MSAMGRNAEPESQIGAQRSGSDLERRSSGMSEPCRPRRGEGYEACDDEDADGAFHLRAYREKRFSVRQDSGEQPKKGRTAA